VAGRRFDDVEARCEVAREVLYAKRRLHAKRVRMAVKTLRRVLEHDPENRFAILGLGQALSLGGSDEGMELMTRAVGMYPTDPEVVHGYGHAVWIAETWQQAEPLLALVLAQRPNDPDLLYDMACARSLEADLAGAAEFLRQAIEAGFRHWDHIETDPDLRNLRADARFADVLREYSR
jgi:Flp pilus assembly protein TadD